MTDTRSALKAYFKNGELPTGGHFAELIDSMALKKSLDDHKDAFTAFKQKEALSVGSGDAIWRLELNETGATLGPLGSELTAALTVTAPLHTDAQRGMPLAEDMLEGVAPRIITQDLDKPESDGDWHTVLNPPGRPVALEITGAWAGVRKAVRNCRR